MTKASKRVVVHPQAPDPARRLVNVVASAMRRQPAQARRHILAGYVGVNLNITRKPDRFLKPGDIVDIFPEEEKVKVPKVKSVPFPKKLSVIYEDSHLLVVDKPAGLLSVPTKKGDRKTMLSLVEFYLQEEDPNAEVFSLQRLDRDVSGVMLFAKDETTYLKLREQFEANKPSRKYVAIIAGHLKAESGTFRTYLATGKNLKRYSVKNSKEGELAITHYKVIRRMPKETIVEVTLETGRRNQIRVHFAEAGHPVIGETRYMRLKAVRPDWDATRIALHANTLGITHPVTGSKMEFCSPWPQSFKDFLKEHEERKTGDKTSANLPSTLKQPSEPAKHLDSAPDSKRKPRGQARREKRKKARAQRADANEYSKPTHDVAVPSADSPQKIERAAETPKIQDPVATLPKSPKPKAIQPQNAKPSGPPSVPVEKSKTAEATSHKGSSETVDKTKTETTGAELPVDAVRPEPTKPPTAPPETDTSDVWKAARLRREQKRSQHDSRS